ncbi:hypothetical protein ACFQH6_20595 [Halobacteriaceae archaeon GCM10025711]
MLSATRREIISFIGISSLSGCISGFPFEDEKPYIPGGSIQFRNDTNTRQTVTITIRHLGTESEFPRSGRRGTPSQPVSDDLSEPITKEMVAEPNDSTVAKQVMTKPGIYFLSGQLSDDQQTHVWYKYSEHEYPIFWLESDSFDAGVAGNSE